MTTRQNPSNATFTPSLADDLTSEMQDWLKTQTDMASQQQEILKLLAGKSEAFERYGLKNDPMNLQNSVIQYWLHIAQDPEKAVKAQADLWQGYMDLCTQTTQHLQSSKVKPFTPVSEEKPDRRFRDPRWTTDPLFNHLRCAYLLMSNWMNKQADEIEKNDPQSARKLRFALRQYTDALSPSNFWMTNPEILDETMKTRGKNLQKGLSNLIHDLKSSKTLPKVSMVKENVFEVGRNLEQPMHATPNIDHQLVLELQSKYSKSQ
jgi:polyhydroxyalkanoate synthase